MPVKQLSNNNQQWNTVGFPNTVTYKVINNGRGKTHFTTSSYIGTHVM